MKTNCRSSILLHKGEDYLLITVNRAELLATVKRATTIAPPDSPLDVLKGVLLESDSARKMLTVTSTNLEVALVEKFHAPHRRTVLSSTLPEPSQKCSSGSRRIRWRSAARKTADV